MFTLEQLLSYSLIFIMFCLGLELNRQAFMRLFEQPKASLIGLAGQLILLPLLALLLALALQLPAAMSAGLLLISLCPGGTTSNLFTRLGRGDAALSISLTCLSSFICVFTLPLIFYGASYIFDYKNLLLKLSLLEAVYDILGHTLAPVLVGMSLAQLLPRWCERYGPWLVRLSALCFMLILVLLWYKNQRLILQAFSDYGIWVAALLFVTVMASIALSKIGQLSQQQAYTLSLEVGLQNGALAFFIAFNLLRSNEAVAISTVYSVLMIPMALLLLAWRKFRTAA